MSNKYLKVPNSISYNSIVEKEYTLSSSQYMDLIMPNKNFLFVRNFLTRDLQRKDLGVEVGSLNYIGQSTHYFVRTKALQAHSFLPEITIETALPIMPNSFVNMNLKQGDLLISKDSNIGEVVILDKDYPNFMLSGAIYRLPVIEKKYYLLAFIKHHIFREQLDFMVPKGSTIRHAKTLFLDCKIPMPNHDPENTIKFVETLTKAIIVKENLIKQRHKTILSLIENEITNNQRSDIFTFELPKLKEISEIGRLDTNLYGKYFKKEIFKIQNYIGGFKSFQDLGFKLIRGNNLAVSVIGSSVYSDIDYKNFYKLFLPKNISKYGTNIRSEYLGNPNKLITLKKGDIIFGAEGFEKGRSMVIFDDSQRNITNFHGMTIRQSTNNLNLTIYFKCLLDYLRDKGLIDLYATGGNGGSLSQSYWSTIPFPMFDENKQKEIVSLYHNPTNSYMSDNITLDNFIEKDDIFNKNAGICELDKTAKQLKQLLNQTIDNITNDIETEINFNILMS
ncbi:restriction endonuclease subunit S domain-containing protein [Chryseobacterium luteum]|uniref:Type I restriction modification DNA specificity domain-containing protein n=1 Tax=Chryseobacterium luteum TaxID=421531 RepID=A0A085ZU43_9FLAO|nr:hypothetical protein [Chryseobacterium luteum]KFF07957.1 hypothetical protein IX38_07265 [Chryseobacterium luteum]